MNNNQIYTGFANNLKKRLDEHIYGKVFATKKYLPVVLVYYESYLSEKDAKRREFMLKRYGSANVCLKKRIEDSINKSQGRGLT